MSAHLIEVPIQSSAAGMKENDISLPKCFNNKGVSFLDADKAYSIFSFLWTFEQYFCATCYMHPWTISTPSKCASETTFHFCAGVINQESRGRLQCYPRLAGILEQQLTESCQWKKALSAQNIQWVTALKWQQPRCKIRSANATTTKTIRKLPIKGITQPIAKSMQLDAPPGWLVSS